VYDAEAPADRADFLRGVQDDKYEYVPAIWGPSYATGALAAGRVGTFEYALEVKNAALASRPESWDATATGLGNPTVSGRVGLRPGPVWSLGASASRGTYFRPEALPTLPAGRDIGDYNEVVFGQDVRFAWHHLQVWAEVYETRFQVPRVGNADSLAYYLEAKYKITPRLFGALRWNQALHGGVLDPAGRSVPWSRDVWRIDTAVGFRLTPHLGLKLQHSLQQEASPGRGPGHLAAGQLTLRF
jgi:hypothetical protein